MKAILKISTLDEKGLIYRIADVIFKYHINILKNDEFVSENMFFFRALLDGEFDKTAFIGTLEAMLPRGAVIECEEKRKKEIIVFATKESHCLGDLLIKNFSNELEANIKAVISNHETLKNLVEKFEIPYHFVPVLETNLNDKNSAQNARQKQEKAVLEVLRKYEFDYLILAKYMRILSPEFITFFENKIINIHHSFLPAFIGANPYKQAFERGVKIIGATAHFVNNKLDEGPIITQDVIAVNHQNSWQSMQQAGRDVEKSVLARALKLVFDERVFINKNKTIIF